MSYIIGYTKKNYEKEKEYKEINKELDTCLVVNKEDLILIRDSLFKYKEIEPEIIGYFLKTPIKNPKILKKYFKQYSHYYVENGIPEKIINKLINIYKKYNIDSSDLVEKWLKFSNEENRRKYIGTLNGNYPLINKNINDIKYLKKILFETKEDFELVNQTKHFQPFLEKIKKDIKILKTVIKLKNKDYILEITE